MLGLRGSTRAVDKFIADCRSIFGDRRTAAVDDRDNEENNVDAAPSCKRFGRVQSRRGGSRVSVEIFNHTKVERTLMWINHNGVPVERGYLRPGQRLVQRTRVGHAWMVTDGPGNCIELQVVRPKTRRFDITFQ